VILHLHREQSTAGATLGRLYVDGRFECYTLEDVVRDVPGQAVYTWKVAGATAIPAGTYPIVITESVRFKRRLPLLIGVPGFAGIRIHPGNVARDTEGCILPGLSHGPARVGESRRAFDSLFAKLEAAVARGDRLSIQITNPAAADVVALAA
jgi:hypothetical protein